VPFALFALAVTGAMVMGLVSAQALVAEGSFQVEELAARAERLEAVQARMEAQVADLSVPGRLARAAREAGLVHPVRFRVLTVPAAGEGPATPKAGDATLALGAGGRG
jgi:outer membrane murein-binding lipoprotein Lpp